MRSRGTRNGFLDWAKPSFARWMPPCRASSATPRPTRKRIRASVEPRSAGFPYGVFYVIRDDRIDVLAVYHARRRPRRFES